MEEIFDIMKLKIPLIKSIIDYVSFKDRLQLKKLLNKKVTKILLTSQIKIKEFSNSTNFNLKFTLTGHTSEICCVVHLKEFRENLIISGGYDNTLRFWELNNGKCLGNYKGDYNIIRDIIYPSKLYKEVVIIRDDSHKVSIFDLRENKVSHVFQFSSKVNSIVLNKNGDKFNKMIAISEPNVGLYFYDMLSAKLISTFSRKNNEDNYIGYLLYEKEGELHHIFECYDENKGCLINLNVSKLPNIELTKVMECNKGLLICYIYIKHLNMIVSSKKTEGRGFLEIFYLNTNTNKTLEFKNVGSLAYDKYSNLLFFENENLSVITLDLITLEEKHTFTHHKEKIPKVICLKHYEGVYVTCSWDGSCSIFDVKNQKLIMILDHSKGFSCCVFVTTLIYLDKTYIISCGSSNNKDIKVWEILDLLYN